MKIQTKLLSLVLLMLLGVSSHALQAEEAKRVGMVVSLKGEATIIRADGTSTKAKLRDPIHVGDRIETAFRASMQIDFVDRSKLSLAGSTDAQVNDYFFDGSKDARSDLTVENGAVRFMAGKIAKIAPKNYKIHTATATIGIRGSSGEFVTSNGKLPGMAKGLQLMKSGGLAVTAQPVGSLKPPIVVSKSGSGLSVAPSGSVQRVQFSGSLVKHYSKTTEKRMAAARTEAKQEQQAEQQNKEGTAEGEPKKKQERKDTAKAGARQGQNENKEPKAEGDVAEGGEPGGEPQEHQAEEGKEPNQPADEKKDQGHNSERKKDKQGRGPLAAKRGGDGPDRKPRNMDRADAGGAPPPPMPEGEHGPGHQPGPEPMGLEMAPVEAEGPPPISLGLDLPTGTLGEIVADAAAAAGAAADAEAANAIIEQYEQFLQEQVPEDETWPAIFFAMDNSGGLIQFFRQLGTVVDDYGQEGVILHLPGLGLSIPIREEANESPLDPTQHSQVQVFVGTDHNEEFAIANRINPGATSDKFGLLVMGENTPAAALPTSGLYMYSSEAGVDPSTDNHEDPPAPPLVASLLVANGKIQNDGFSMHAAVDFGAGKVGGITERIDHWDDYDYGPNEGTHEGPEGPEHYPHDDHAVHTLFLGELNGQGQIQNVEFFANSGFMPSHVNLDDATPEPPVTYGLKVNELSALQGGNGRLLGSQFQGLVVEGAGPNEAFIGAAFREGMEPPIPSNDGAYGGLGYGVRINGGGFSSYALSKISSMQLNPTFGSNTVTGHLHTDDGRQLNVGSRTFVVDREIVVGELVDAIASGTIYGAGNFFMTRDLPEIYDHVADQEYIPEDVMWGTWNVLEGTSLESPPDGVYPGLHNVWVAAKPTVVGAGATVKDKLAVAYDVQWYHGALMSSFVDGDGLLGAGVILPDDGASLYGEFGAPVDPLTPAGPSVTTVTGMLTAAVNYQTNKAVAIAHLHNGAIVIMRNTPSITENDFNGWATAYHMGGMNVETSAIFQANGAGTSEFEGFYAGTGASTLALSFSKESADPDHFAYGVGVAQKSFGGPATTHSLTVYGHGMWENLSTQAVSVLDNPDLKVSINADPTNFDLSGNFYVEGGSPTLALDTGTLNTYIDKNSFFTEFDDGGSPVQFDGVMPSNNLDPSNLYIVGMPGMEEFEHLSWGMWGAVDTGGNVATYGFFAGGVDNFGGSPTDLPDFTALAASGNPIVHYNGHAMAKLVDGTEHKMLHGGAHFEVNFNTAAITGDLDFGPEKIDLNGTVNAGAATFSGSAGFEGQSLTKTFKGGFYADEIAGSFGAENGTKKMTGAFGAKADRAIPYQP